MNTAAEHTQNYPTYSGQSPATKAYLFAKRTFYYICKAIGLFNLAGFMTRRKLRIITYHGFSLVDESLFRPRTFINPDTFHRRMKYLSDKGFNVLELGEALELLDQDRLPQRAVVITIDDGFYSMYKIAFPVLKDFSFPATVYVTSYYVEKENPIFGLAVQYMFWKTKEKVLELAGLGVPECGSIPLGTSGEETVVCNKIIKFGEEHCNEDERMRMLETLGEKLDVDFRAIAESRILNIMNRDEIRELVDTGIDIQLHTHRHEFPADHDSAVREISDNRETLAPLVRKSLKHFCYPGGHWVEEQWAWLKEVGIVSAATCNRGLNPPGTPAYGLKRFGDDEALSQIEFEAELFGFTEIFRNLFSR